ncbi:hypothetical protein VPNG_03295 [Cytospora leucostoma]|uniref:Tafazzin n=1 Tax=Cytospora leucostoma TaxID=1230097 RepID=A0A423XEB0_9PEZI|nr:hypothetical protein VPNG_03295 [Cytospora leucostoma]
MPKKRHQSRYSKPQSTAPASLAGSSSSAAGRNGNRDGDHDRSSVNQLLASLRRTRLSSDQQASASSAADIAAPSVPPQIRQILALPETPAPAPRPRARLHPRVDAQGRRLPAGPPPPRSWLSRPRDAPGLVDFSVSAAADYEGRQLPGLYRPEGRSLMGIVMRRMVLDWEFQRSYNLYYLYSLPDRVRMALISYLATFYEPGLSLSDLKILLLPHLPEDDGQDYGAEPTLSPSALNEGITHLDLSASVGRSIRLRELSSLLFPVQHDAASPEPLDSWDAAETSTTTTTTTIPRPLLPNLTHLSLAAAPATSPAASWRQLLALSRHLPTLTHLSLAYWPVPSLTPNATSANAKVVTAAQGGGRVVQYGGANPYSHSLDGDWSEAVLILRKLSQALYGLEHLDLTGCAAWARALTVSVGLDGGKRDMVDWVGDWGKVERLVLTTGWCAPRPHGEGEGAAARAERFRDILGTARGTERAIRARRAGRGRFITVETDRGLDEE